MNTPRRVAVAVMFAWLVSHPAFAADLQNLFVTPTRIESQKPGLPPLWLSVNAAVDASGELTSDLGPGVAERLKRLATRRGRPNPSADSNDPCQSYIGMPVMEHFRPTETAEDLLFGAKQIVAGTIVASGEGFYLEIPGRLLTIQLNRPSLKTIEPTSEAHPDPIFLFFPDARIITPSIAYCSLADSDAHPQPGDRIVLFAMTEGDDAERLSFRASPSREMVIETADGKLFLPEALRSDPRFNSLGRFIRRHRWVEAFVAGRAAIQVVRGNFGDCPTERHRRPRPI